jgi:hypothetical protein
MISNLCTAIFLCILQKWRNCKLAEFASFNISTLQSSEKTKKAFRKQWHFITSPDSSTAVFAPLKTKHFEQFIELCC